MHCCAAAGGDAHGGGDGAIVPSHPIPQTPSCVPGAPPRSARSSQAGALPGPAVNCIGNFAVFGFECQAPHTHNRKIFLACYVRPVLWVSCARGLLRAAPAARAARPPASEAGREGGLAGACKRASGAAFPGRAGGRPLSAPLPALVFPLRRPPAVDRDLRAGPLNGPPFRVGQVLAHVFAVAGLPALGAARVRAVDPPLSVPDADLERPAAHAAVRRSLETAERALPVGGADAPVPRLLARTRAVPDRPIGRRERLAALLAPDAEHPSGLPCGPVPARRTVLLDATPVRDKAAAAVPAGNRRLLRHCAAAAGVAVTAVGVPEAAGNTRRRRRHGRIPGATAASSSASTRRFRTCGSRQNLRRMSPMHTRSPSLIPSASRSPSSTRIRAASA